MCLSREFNALLHSAYTIPTVVHPDIIRSVLIPPLAWARPPKPTSDIAGITVFEEAPEGIEIGYSVLLQRSPFRTTALERASNREVRAQECPHDPPLLHFWDLGNQGIS
jgi:hypothetical protein